MGALKGICIFYGSAFGMVAILTMLCGHTTVNDIFTSLFSAISASVASALITYGITIDRIYKW